MQETSVSTCASFSLHPSLSIFPFSRCIPSQSHVLCEYNVEWVFRQLVPLPATWIIVKNKYECVCSGKGAAFASNCQCKDILVEPPNFMSLVEVKNAEWNTVSSTLELCIIPALRQSCELFCRVLLWSIICRKPFDWSGWIPQRLLRGQEKNRGEQVRSVWLPVDSSSSWPPESSSRSPRLFGGVSDINFPLRADLRVSGVSIIFWRVVSPGQPADPEVNCQVNGAESQPAI